MARGDSDSRTTLRNLRRIVTCHHFRFNTARRKCVDGTCALEELTKSTFVGPARRIKKKVAFRIANNAPGVLQARPLKSLRSSPFDRRTNGSKSTGARIYCACFAGHGLRLRDAGIRSTDSGGWLHVGRASPRGTGQTKF